MENAFSSYNLQQKQKNKILHEKFITSFRIKFSTLKGSFEYYKSE